MAAMIEAKSSVTLQDIRKVVQQIVDRWQPQKVILFGSHAEGMDREESDVDLLVVMETEEKPIHAAAHIAATVDHPFAMDIVVFTPGVFQASLHRKGNFATEVMTKGVVLHEA